MVMLLLRMRLETRPDLNGAGPHHLIHVAASQYDLKGYDMDRIIVSAPRSGLNWVRFCVEKFYGRRTPGKKQLISKEDDSSSAFVRSHDALGYTRIFRRGSGAWRPIDTGDTNADTKCVLILRDPLETFVRASKKSLWRFRAYVGNIHFHSRCHGERCIVHYDKLTTDPKAMLDLFDFMAFEPAEGTEPPDPEVIERTWAEAAAQSRSTYDVNQAGSGGATTKDNPTDFKFHQRSLSDFERRMVWDFLRRRLSSDEMALVGRYEPDFTCRLSFLERFRTIPYMFR